MEDPSIKSFKVHDVHLYMNRFFLINHGSLLNKISVLKSHGLLFCKHTSLRNKYIVS